MTIEKTEKALKSIDTGMLYVIVAFTDEYLVDKWNKQVQEKVCSKLALALEIRVFSINKEYKFFRADISKEFVYRELGDATEEDDTTLDKERSNNLDYYDEWQYLDIDTTKGILDGEVTTTGGGMYKYLGSDYEHGKVRIRYYFGKYKDTWHARIEDWRVVEFK